MWRWPKRLFLLALVLFFGGMALGYATDVPEGESGIAAVAQAIAVVMVTGSLIAVPLLALLVLASIFNQPGEPKHWVWRGWLSGLAYLGWLGICFFIWLAAHTGDGGLDGPCIGPVAWGSEVGASHCTTEIADWPPLSTRAIAYGPEGHFENVFPSTVELIAIVALALLPLALWPLGRWLTGEEKGGPAPVRPVLTLIGSAMALGLTFSLFVDEESSRPLSAAERSELAADLTQSPDRPLPVPAPVPSSPVVIDATRVAADDVARAAAAANQTTETGKTICAPGDVAGIGLWTCATTLGDGSVLSSRITVSEDGTYGGVYADRTGVEQPYRGCCIPVASRG